jgi:hypothetical protein
VTGSGFDCPATSSFSSGYGNIVGLSYDITPGEIHVFGAGNDLEGTIVWTYSGALTPGGALYLEGWLTVTDVDGFYNEYAVGGVYFIDLTLTGCSGNVTEAGALNGGVTTCAHPSSGEVPVPEPGTLSLLGMGLVTLAGSLRRKFRS